MRGHPLQTWRRMLAPHAVCVKKSEVLTRPTTPFLLSEILRYTVVLNIGKLRGKFTWPRHFPSPVMPARRLEDRIRELCTRLLAEPESGPEWTATAKELQFAIKTQIGRMVNATTALAVFGKSMPERRKR
jgi:hypothetical protein